MMSREENNEVEEVTAVATVDEPTAEVVDCDEETPLPPGRVREEVVCSKCNGTGKVLRTRQVKVDHPQLPCLCGCGKLAKPRSNFLPGHDARVKGYISRALKWEAGDDTQKDYEIPQVLVDKVNEDPTFMVAKMYNAETILRLAEAVGTR